jgi:hypothetical protein
MEKIDIPIVTMQEPLHSVLRTMKTEGRRAALAEDDGGPWIFTASQIATGIASGKQSLADLAEVSRAPVHVLSDTEAAGIGPDLTDVGGAYPSLERLLDRINCQYALRGDQLEENRRLLWQTLPPTLGLSLGRMANILTRHERLAIEIGSGPPDYFCAANPNHEFPPLSRQNDGTCPLDDSAVIQV